MQKIEMYRFNSITNITIEFLITVNRSDCDECDLMENAILNWFGIVTLPVCTATVMQPNYCKT